MQKIKLTKGELKKQRDSLRQFSRYLPTLQLKKQQLQVEILYWNTLLQEKNRQQNAKKLSISAWAGLLIEPGIDLKQWLIPSRVLADSRNIAGASIPVFRAAQFPGADYDLFAVPQWVDPALESLQELVSLREEIRIIGEAVEILKHELRITTQRVNLFEKVKIPQAQTAIGRIKIYIGDQMANAVGRSKMAKRKIESAGSSGVLI